MAAPARYAPWKHEVAERVRAEAMNRYEHGVDQAVDDAITLACDWIEAAARHEVTEDDLALVASIPSTALDAILARNHRRSQR